MDLCRGELVVLQGRSGSGKSTLLALLAGWCVADQGWIERNGDWAQGDRWRLWASTAIVPQVLGLADELSVEENLEHVLRLHKEPRVGRRHKVAETLEALDLLDQAMRRPGEISLGQQQRVAVGRATIATPVVLLADEPTCHQDPTHRHSVLAVLRKIADGGGAVLIATHDPSVADVSDRVMSLDN
jgi:ABC-type lipoprotein export system ATPase subunit